MRRISILDVLGFGTLVPPAQAQAFNLLYTFTGGAAGANPQSSLVQDSAGTCMGLERIANAFGVSFD